MTPSPNSHQLWTKNTDGQLVNAASGRCLTVAGGQTATPTQLVVEDCSAGNEFQRWTAPTRAGTSSYGPVWSVGAPKMCAGLWTANEPGNAPVMLKQCYGLDYQRLTMADNGTLQVLGQCVEIPWGVTASGTGVEINACPPAGSEQWAPHQLWTKNAVGQLVNTASGRCLTVTDGTSTSPQQLVVRDCDPANALQQWLAPQKAKRTSTAYSYNAADQLTSTVSGSTTTAYGYDPNGNQTSAGAVTTTFDLASRTTSSTTSATTTSHTYDGLGKRLTQATNGTIDTRFTWDPNHGLPQLATETTAAGGLISRYVNGVDGPLSMTGTGGTSYYHRDVYGSITDVTSSAGGSQWQYSYEPFGAARTTTKVDPAAAANPMQYTGQYLDSATGQYHLRARQYDPNIGRFTATDPLSPQLDDPYVASYAYSDNRPTLFDDPSGLSKCEVGWNPVRWGGNAVDCAGKVAMSDAAGDIATTVHRFNPLRFGVEQYKRGYQQYMCDDNFLAFMGSNVLAGVEVVAGGVVATGVVVGVGALGTIALAAGSVGAISVGAVTVIGGFVVVGGIAYPSIVRHQEEQRERQKKPPAPPLPAEEGLTPQKTGQKYWGTGPGDNPDDWDAADLARKGMKLSTAKKLKEWAEATKATGRGGDVVTDRIGQLERLISKMEKLGYTN